MLKRYLEKLISFGCSLQDVPRVDVSYEMPEGQNYHLVKYIPGKQGCLYVDIDANAFAVMVMKVYFGVDSPVNHDLPMTRVMLASHRLSQQLNIK